MTPHADSPEFTALLERWLDGTASMEEVALLWQCVAQCPRCASQVAAAARFEGLLADVIKARDVEEEARRVLAVQPRQPPGAKTTRLPLRPPPSPLRHAALAAALALLGVAVVLLWPDTPPSTLARSRQPHPPPERVPTPPLPEPPPTPQAAVPHEAAVAGTPEPPPAALVERLESYFLGPVSIKNLPLSQAMAVLRGLLQQKDATGALGLAALQVTVPAGAMNRRVTFESQGPLPYLKAVRAVAAMAGCDVQAQDRLITLVLHPGVFPPAVEKRQVADMLAGRLTRDGTSVIQDAARLEALWADAALLGISPAEDGTALISRGQWEALRQLTDSRDFIASLPLPSFAVFTVPAEEAPETDSGILTPDQGRDFLNRAASRGLRPDLVFTPQEDRAGNLAPLIATPDGDSILITPRVSGPADSPEQQAGPQQFEGEPPGMKVAVGRITLRTGGGSMSYTLAGGTVLTMSTGGSGMHFLTSPTVGSNSTVQVVVPVAPPPPVEEAG